MLLYYSVMLELSQILIILLLLILLLICGRLAQHIRPT